MCLNTALLRKAHYHRAEFLCKCFPEPEPKQFPDGAGETPGAFVLPRSVCDLSEYKQVTRLFKMTCTAHSSYMDFPLNTLVEKAVLRKTLISHSMIFLWIKICFKNYNSCNNFTLSSSSLSVTLIRWMLEGEDGVADKTSSNAPTSSCGRGLKYCSSLPLLWQDTTSRLSQLRGSSRTLPSGYSLKG